MEWEFLHFLIVASQVQEISKTKFRNPIFNSGFAAMYGSGLLIEKPMKQKLVGFSHRRASRCTSTAEFFPAQRWILLLLEFDFYFFLLVCTEFLF